MADLEQMYSALEKADAAGEVDDAREIAAMIREYHAREQEPETSTLAALGHGALRGALPAAAGIIGGAGGATVGAAAGPVGIIGGGLAGGFGASAAASAAQEEFLNAHPEFAKALGIDTATAAKEAKEHPYASMAGELAPNLLAFRPSGALLRSGKGLAEEAAQKLAAEKSAAIANSVINAGVGAGMEAGQQAVGEEPMDYTKLGIAALGGALGQKETGIGRGLTHIGEIPASAATRATLNAFRRPGEAVAPEVPPSATEAPVEPTVAPPSASQDTQAALNEIPKAGEAIGTPIKPIEPVEPAVAPNAPVEPPVVEPLKPVEPVTPEPMKDIFSFMGDNGEIKTVQGDVKKINGKDHVIYQDENGKKRQKVLNDKVVQNPTDDTLELLELYHARNKIEKEPDDFSQWLNKVGIHSKEKSDLDYEKSLPHPYIRDNGHGLDDLTLMAQENGLLSPHQLTEGVGGVESMREHINAALNGERVPTPNNIDQQARYHAVDSRIQELEAKLQAQKEFGLQAETPAESQARMDQEAAAKKAQEDAETQAAMDAQAEKDRAEIARRSEEQKDNFQLGQTPEESLTGQQRLIGQDDDIPFDFSRDNVQGTQEQIDKAKQSANKFIKDSDVAWQDGDLGLIRTYGAKTGEVIYVPYKDGAVYQNDVSQFGDAGFKKFGFTPKESEKMLSARKKLEEEAQLKHEKAPYLKFEKDVQFSPDIPEGMQKVAEQWKNLLGIKQKIYFTSLEHAASIKDQFTGPHRAIGGASASREEGGFTKTLKDGNRVVAFQQYPSTAKTLEVLAHELGHAHMEQSYFSAPDNVKAALQKEHQKWAKTITGKTFAKDIVQSLRARKQAKTTQVPEGLEARHMAGIDNYWRTFEEWYADQTSKWATTQEKPLTIVEKFFSKLGKALKNFYNRAKNSGYLPTETFKQYMDSQVSKLDLEPPTTKELKPIASEDQRLLFNKSKVEEEKAPISEKNVLSAMDRYNQARYAKEFPGVDVNALPKETGATFETPTVSHLTEFIRKSQDRYIDLKRTMAAIKKSGTEIAERFNPYAKLALYTSKYSNSARVFEEKYIAPLAKKMDQLGLTSKEVSDYLHNRHAEERNNQMNKINPDIVQEDGTVIPYPLKDRASGIHTDDAREYLSKLEGKKKAALESVAKDIDDIKHLTQKLLVSSGQETQATIDKWNETYKDYVPLQRVQDEAQFPLSSSGKGMGVSGSFGKRAMGSEREVTDIINNVIGQHERALEIAAKMEVDHSLYGLAIKAPNPEVWKAVNPDAIKNPELLARELNEMGLNGNDIVGLMKEPQERRLVKDTATGLEHVEYRTNPLKRYGDNVLPIRINGQDRFIFFNPKNTASMNMARAFRNLDTPTIGLIGKQIGKATQWMAKVNTQWNPVFGALNFTRDFGSAMANLSSTELKGQQSKVAGGIKPAMQAVWQVMRHERSGQPLPDNAWAKSYLEFRDNGGQTLYREQLKRRTDQKNIIDEKIDAMHSNPAKKAARAFFDGLSDFNDSVENAIRLSAFKAARDKGLSPEHSARIAKELTVNFDRKGAYGQVINNYFAFFNASAQGVARMTQTLSGPAGKKIMLGGVGLGAMQAGMMAMAGFGPDDPPEFVKSRNFIIPTPDGKYIAIPYPLGLHFLPNIGRIAVETGLHGDFTKHAGNMAAVISDAFNPLGGSDLSLQTISPTILDPVVGLATNKDAFGRPISRQDRPNEPSTGLSRSSDRSTTINKKIAEAINYITGGTEDVKGFLSPTADQLDYLVGQGTGGVGREIMKIGKVGTAVSTGNTDQLASYDIPLAGRFYGDINSPAANSQHFYDNITKMAEHEATIKGMRERKENVNEYMQNNPEARLWQQANNASNQIALLNKQKRQWEKQGRTDEQIRTLDDRKQAIMTRFNERVNALQ